MIQATAIEMSLDYLGGLRVSDYEDRDVRRSVFLTMWKTIHAHWKKLWQPKSRLVSKVGIVCLTRFLIDMIVSWSDNEELEIELTDLEDMLLKRRRSSRSWMNGSGPQPGPRPLRADSIQIKAASVWLARSRNCTAMGDTRMSGIRTSTSSTGRESKLNRRNDAKEQRI